ncbi:MAG: hypothetical protein ACT4PG_02755 [Panacagrimonas sp.]
MKVRTLPYRHLFAAFLSALVATHVQADEPVAGCDQERWDNWAELAEEAIGMPEEQALVRRAADFNRQVCADLAAGKVTESEADQIQSDSIKRLWRDLQSTRSRRQERIGAQSAG